MMETDEKPYQTGVFSVGQVNTYIRYLLEADGILDSLTVRGEISNLTAHHASGHLYFSVKDDTAVLRVVMFRSQAMRLKFAPQNGMKVLLHGRITVYEPSGQYQLNADAMEPDGLGALAAAFEQCKRKLEAEGLFDEAKKKMLPAFPDTVGVITSPTGAAVRDIINIITRRSPQTKIILFPALVQGEAAPRQLASGIRFFNQRKQVDVIIIGRGGGSMEDLWAFNDETLARTVAASEIPVISAVGHETDFTICDFVADKRAPTPSAAAELSVPDTKALLMRLHSLSDALQNRMDAILAYDRQRLRVLADNRVLKSPDNFLTVRRMTLDALSVRMERAAEKTENGARNAVSDLEIRLRHSMENRIKQSQTAYRTVSVKLGALNPLSVLARGYSAVFDENGVSVRSLLQLSVGDTITMKTTDGDADAVITALHPEKENING